MSKKVPISEEEAQAMMQREEQQRQRSEAMSEQKDSMMRAFVSADGRERLERIRQVKPERAAQVEMHILNNVRQGKLQPPVGDDIVRELLSALSDQGGAKASTITVVRKKNSIDDDDW